MNPVSPEAAQVVASAWRDQAVWSAAAGRLKAELDLWRRRAAVGGVLGAMLATAATASAAAGNAWWWPRMLASLAGALALAVVPYVSKTKVSSERVRAWVRARSASEALKETIYRYLLGAAPFGADAPASELIRRCQLIKARVEDLGAAVAAITPPTKARPLSMTVDDYVHGRVNDQVDGYYYPKAAENALAAKRLQRLEFALGLLAVALGAAAGAAVATGVTGLAMLAPWVGVATAAAAAVTAHRAAMRYDHGAMIYFSTAERLRGLRDEWLVTANRFDPPIVAAFVDNCERAISTENEAWLAEWAGRKAAG